MSRRLSSSYFSARNLRDEKVIHFLKVERSLVYFIAFFSGVIILGSTPVM